MSVNKVLLPFTRFPARISSKLRSKHDRDIQRASNFDKLYEWQRNNLTTPDFILHDGPPYANGEPHIGHAVNKIIKDIINRHHLLNGKRVHYIPGWDCHGLPIELKALSAYKTPQSKDVLQVYQLRGIARRYASETSYIQREAFKSWGIMADWENECYFTYDKKYVQNQLRQFYNLFKKKIVYRSVKPVYWSPSSGTALAEAELEYDPNFHSTEVYLKIPLVSLPERVKNLPTVEKCYAIIWTTTPWSLVGNQAICYSQDLQYSVVHEENTLESVYIIASTLVDNLKKILNKNLTEICTLQGCELSIATYNHPLTNNLLPFLHGQHVKSDKGTGLVHTAPAHGHEDFLVALNNNIEFKCHVNENGKYENTLPWLNGQYVLKEGQQMIIEHLKDQILYSGLYKHSYPIDWRTKAPIIIRASNQWFIDTNAIKNQAMEALEDVKILPSVTSKHYKDLFMKYLQNRPYWCISRQRLWGVPIPAVYYKNKPLINNDLVENICNLLNESGSDFWWSQPLEKIVPKSLLQDNDVSIEQLEKGMDIMDIWLDSGLSWSHVLNDKKADIYSEGLDQFSGWFQSSLLTSIALNGTAPYKTIFVHGFVVDSEGHKMSKSLGNVIDPEVIISGGKNQQKDPPYGVDVLRWWVAAHGTQHSQVVITKSILENCSAEVSKIRLLIRYLLSCIHDIEASMLDLEKFELLDSYMLHSLYNFKIELKKHYESMEYNKICTSLLYFLTNDISGFYCHTIKDRLYCNAALSSDRRASQVVINHLLLQILQGIAPVLPHLAEEAWGHYSLYNGIPFHQSNHEDVKAIWNRPYIDNLMDDIFDIKKEINKHCEKSNTFKYGAIIKANPEFFDKLILIQKTDSAIYGDLCDILQVSHVHLIEGKSYENEWSLSLKLLDKKNCQRCRKFASNAENEFCERCKKVVENMTKMNVQILV